MSCMKASHIVLAASTLALACKPAPTSELKDLATAKSFKTGLFSPVVKAKRTTVTSAGKKRTIKDFVRAFRLNVDELAAKSAHVVLSAYGESILFVTMKDLFPIPTFAIDRKGQRYQFTGNLDVHQGDIKFLPVFVKHPFGEPAKPEVDNQFIVRVVKNRVNHHSALLVPWTRHIRTESGAVLYRFGNNIVAAANQKPMVEFQQIQEKLWRMVGLYEDGDVCSNTLFWQAKPDRFYSYTKGDDQIVAWQQQDDDSLDRLGTRNVSEDELPKAVRRHAERCERDLESITLVGVRSNTFDPDVVNVYDDNLDEKPTADSAFGLAASWEAEADSAAGFGLNSGNIRPFEKNKYYANGTKVQLADGRIYQVARSVKHNGWFSDYYTYDMVNYSGTNHGMRGRVAYSVDTKGRITDKRHVRTLATELQRDMERMEDKRVQNLKDVAASNEATRRQLEFADRTANTIDSWEKIAVYGASKAALDKVVRGNYKTVADPLAKTGQRMIAGSKIAAVSTAGTVAQNAVINSDESASDQAAKAGYTGLSAFAIQAAKADVIPGVPSGMAGVAAGAAKGMLQKNRMEAQGFETPGALGTTAWVGTEAATEGARQWVARTGAFGAQNAAVYRGLPVISNIAANAAVGNNYASAHTGALIEGVVDVVPMPVVVKGEAAVVARQANSLLQYGETGIRSSITSHTIDEGLINLENKRQTAGALDHLNASMTSFDQSGSAFSPAAPADSASAPSQPSVSTPAPSTSTPAPASPGTATQNTVEFN